jgi:hypothetical protein
MTTYVWVMFALFTLNAMLLIFKAEVESEQEALRDKFSILFCFALSTWALILLVAK